jgi:hypothetical protein
VGGGEAGAHKIVARADDSDALAPFQTVAIEVDALDEETTPSARLRELWEQVREVFDGQIDAFILAYLRTQEPAEAWERA